MRDVDDLLARADALLSLPALPALDPVPPAPWVLSTPPAPPASRDEALAAMRRVAAASRCRRVLTGQWEPDELRDALGVPVVERPRPRPPRPIPVPPAVAELRAAQDARAERLERDLAPPPAPWWSPRRWVGRG
ncbi:hypothetical protein SUDANB95_05494 [Actinosynnema sp. ALI-1.44]